MTIGYAANYTFARKNIHHLMLSLGTESEMSWPIYFNDLEKWQPIQLCSLQICDGKIHQRWKHLQGSHWSFYILCPHRKIQTARSPISRFPYLQSKMGCRVWHIQTSCTVFFFCCCCRIYNWSLRIVLPSKFVDRVYGSHLWRLWWS